jgi:hypothetical protein
MTNRWQLCRAERLITADPINQDEYAIGNGNVVEMRASVDTGEPPLRQKREMRSLAGIRASPALTKETWIQAEAKTPGGSGSLALW